MGHGPWESHGIGLYTDQNRIYFGWKSFYKTKQSIRRLMNYLDQEYNSTQYPIIVTENGISSKGNGSDEDPELNDHWRADFYHGYIGQLHRAITEDKVNVFGYTGT